MQDAKHFAMKLMQLPFVLKKSKYILYVFSGQGPAQPAPLFVGNIIAFILSLVKLLSLYKHEQGCNFIAKNGLNWINAFSCFRLVLRV